MSSLQVVEGLIGTGCAIASLYYVRRGMRAAQPQTSQQALSWQSALAEYARKNPFAAVFGALALGFLFSSWSIAASPHATTLVPPHPGEKLRTITRNVPVPDPAQAAKIATLQTTINANNVTIASQKAEIDRLTGLLAKPAFRSRRTRGFAATPAELANAGAPPNPMDTRTNAPLPAAPANAYTSPAAVAAGANTQQGANPPAAPSNPGNANASPGAPPAEANGSAAPTSTPSANSASLVPH